MQIGDYVETPRFLRVKIEEVFENKEAAYEAKYTEPTHYKNPDWDILGWVYEPNHMKFAAVRK
jgi:hypothetical protein